MYKGYQVIEEIIKDYQHPQIDLVLQAPCGCSACGEEVQQGHFACSTSPAKLIKDQNVLPVLENNRWYWSYHGPN